MDTSTFYKNECDDLDVKAEDPMWNECHNYLLERIIKIANLNVGDKILDIGCGSARICNIIGNKWLYYTGIDISSKIIKIAKKKHPSETFHVCNAKDLSIFNDNEFDVVVCSEVMEHLTIREWGSVMIEIKRVCKANGTIVFSMPNMYYLWAYVPYHFKPVKQRLTLKQFFEGCSDGMNYENYYTSERKKVYLHRRIKPSLLKEILNIYFKVDKIETTQWYNNRVIHNVMPNIQKKILHLSMKTSGIFGSQIVVRCINAESDHY